MILEKKHILEGKGNWFSIKYSAQLLFLFVFGYITYKGFEDPYPSQEMTEAEISKLNVNEILCICVL
jgi:hypothetical protein